MEDIGGFTKHKQNINYHNEAYRQIDTHRADGNRRVVLEFSLGHFAVDSAGCGASEVTTRGRVMVRLCTDLVHGQTKEVLPREFNSKCRKYDANLK